MVCSETFSTASVREGRFSLSAESRQSTCNDSYHVLMATLPTSKYGSVCLFICFDEKSRLTCMDCISKRVGNGPELHKAQDSEQSSACHTSACGYLLCFCHSKSLLLPNLTKSPFVHRSTTIACVRVRSLGIINVISIPLVVMEMSLFSSDSIIKRR